jgi:hypothetical protein
VGKPPWGLSMEAVRKARKMTDPGTRLPAGWPGEKLPSLGPDHSGLYIPVVRVRSRWM